VAKVKSRNVRIEEATNGFIVRTEKRVESQSAEGVLYPDWQSEEHVAKDLAEANKIVSSFMEAAASEE